MMGLYIYLVRKSLRETKPTVLAFLASPWVCPLPNIYSLPQIAPKDRCEGRSQLITPYSSSFLPPEGGYDQLRLL